MKAVEFIRDINPGEEITKKYNMQGNWTK